MKTYVLFLKGPQGPKGKVGIPGFPGNKASILITSHISRF